VIIYLPHSCIVWICLDSLSTLGTVFHNATPADGVNITLVNTKNKPIRAADIVNWSSHAVALYAHTQPLFQPYASQFKDLDINGECFLRLEWWFLHHGVGVTDLRVVMDMVHHIRGLLEQDPITDLKKEGERRRKFHVKVEQLQRKQREERFALIKKETRDPHRTILE
jgi:hypothetical protein